MGELHTKFSNHVLDSTKAFKLVLTDKKDVAGLPESALSLAAETAKKKEVSSTATAENGPWVVTLDAPSYVPVLQHAENRALRQKVHHAALVKASEFTFGDNGSDQPVEGYERPANYDPGKESVDNAPLILEILRLREEKAKLLGFENYAEQSLATKMATLPGAWKLIEDLRLAAWEHGVAEMHEVEKFAKESGTFPGEFVANGGPEVRNWDMGFWSERLKEKHFAFKEEELRPYFPLPHVLKGLFELVHRLFGIEVVEKTAEAGALGASLWHPDVKLFEVKRGGKVIAYFYLDPYSRPENKKSGAWMKGSSGRTENVWLVEKGSGVGGVGRIGLIMCSNFV